MDDKLILKKTWLIPSREGRLEDHYNVDLVKDVIGSGSFATVVKATTKEGHQPRAIKILRKERISDQEKFKAEIDILKKLDHPNIIKLYETFENPKHVYLVTELCKGGEVFDRIIEKGQFTEAEARKVFTEMMRAISYCHAHGICHRDLKPENFMYVENTPDSSIKVIDFGLARNFVYERKGQTTKTKMTTKVGTSYYIAPEVISGSYDESCDIWSAGVILYILLAGYPPFDGRTDLQIIEKVVKGKYSLETREWKDVSELAKDLIRHMICKPEERLKAAEVLQHPWVLQDESKDGKCLNIDFQTFKNFRNAQKFKKVALTAIASQMSEAEIKELSEQFTRLDKNGDGVLTFEELEEGLCELKDKNITDIRAILDSVDTDKNGTIDYTEFISATMEKNEYLKEEKLLEAFKLFDKDGNGKITADELREILGNDPVWKQDTEYYEEMIKEADLDGDGMIDYNEFLEMMKKN